MKFQYPFPGKRKPVELVSMFLLEPDFFLKLHNAPLSMIFKTIGEESLLKRAQNVSKIANPKKLLRDLSNKLVEYGNTVMGELLIDEDSDEKYDFKASQNKVYKYVFAGMNGQNNFKLTYRASFILEVESQISAADLLFKQGRYEEAVADLIKQPISKSILWDEANEILNSGKCYTDLRFLRYSLSLEMLLACLAAMDVNLSVQYDLPSPVFTDILPTEANGMKNPTSLIFHAYKNEMKATTIGELVNQARVHKVTYDNLKHWSNGTYLPDFHNFIGMVDDHFDGSTHQMLQGKYIAAKVINYIGYTFGQFQTMATSLAHLNQLNVLRPLPDFPFGHRNIQDWLNDRYFYWIEYHQTEISRKGCFPSDSELLSF